MGSFHLHRVGPAEPFIVMLRMPRTIFVYNLTKSSLTTIGSKENDDSVQQSDI